ncbi:hypothetical protein ACP275_06G145400 [Erythranthe tilingii]
MASSNHHNVTDNPPNEASFIIANTLRQTNAVMEEASRKIEHKDNLLEAALEYIQTSRLEKEKLKTTEYQLKAKVRDLEAEIEILKAEKQTLVMKERTRNDELQAARKEAIRELGTMLNYRSLFSIKMMGEISRKPFEDMCFKKYSNSKTDWRNESQKLFSMWEENVKNPQWRPFKRFIKHDGTFQETIDENDAKLKELRKEGSEKVYESVVNAVLEMNEYNPSRRYSNIPELWNNKENRKASLKEIIHYICKQLKSSNSKRKRAFAFP